MTSVNRRARCRLRFSWWVLLVICSKGVDSSYVICSEGAMTGSGPPVSELKTESSLDPCSVGPLARVRSRKVKPSQSSSSVQQSSQVMAVDRHPATLAVYTLKITHFSVFTVFILDSCYCRMTNCELLHWLVKNAVTWHSSLSNAERVMVDGSTLQMLNRHMTATLNCHVTRHHCKLA